MINRLGTVPFINLAIGKSRFDGFSIFNEMIEFVQVECDTFLSWFHFTAALVFVVFTNVNVAFSLELTDLDIAFTS